MLAERKPYTIKDPAQKFVAGVRRPPSGPIMLTDAEAEHEKRLGNIAPVKDEPAAPAPELDGPKSPKK